MTEPLSALDIMRRLVAFPTVSRDSNLDLVDWVEEYLDGFGVKAHRVYDATGKKAALYANVGPEVPDGIVLSGHTDVVPVDGQAWSSDPFEVTERDGKYFGRGTCDMKGFDALALSAVPLALASDLKRPLQIALSYDEEVGCVGAPPMIDDMLGVLPKAKTAIIGEPSMMKTVTAHKGGSGFAVHVQGFEVHSSIMHTGVNAVMEAARLIDWANQMNTEIRAKSPSDLAAIFEPPYTTLQVGTIEGGTAHNITAKDCRFALDFRVVPGEDVENWKARFLAKVAEVEAEMKAVHPDAAISAKSYFGVPGLRPEVDGPAETLVRQLTGDNGQHVVSYGTEAGHFQDRGYSAVVCGPGNIEQAHQADEFISKAQFEAGEKFIAQVVETLTR